MRLVRSEEVVSSEQSMPDKIEDERINLKATVRVTHKFVGDGRVD